MKVTVDVTRPALVFMFAVQFATAASIHAASSRATPPVITKQPVNQTVKPMGSITFSVTASGTAPLSYQWHRSGMTWANWNRRTLTLPAVTVNDVGTYTVTITNAAGSVTSIPATLTLRNGSDQAAPEPVPVPPPAVSGSGAGAATSVSPHAGASANEASNRTRNAETTPSPATEPPALVGQTVTFVATADGSPPFAFQWKKDGKTLGGETHAKLVLRDLKLSDAGEYVCIVSNSAGSTPSPPFTLAVVPAPSQR